MITLKQDSLGKFLGSYISIWFIAMFISTLLGKTIYTLFSTKVLDSEDILLCLAFAGGSSFILFLFHRDKYKDLFILLNNDKIEVPKEFDKLENIKVNNPPEFIDIIQELKSSNLRISMIDYDKKVIKVRKKHSFYTLGCVAILYFDNSQKDLNATLLSLDYNRKDRLNNFKNELFNIIEIKNAS